MSDSDSHRCAQTLVTELAAKQDHADHRSCPVLPAVALVQTLPQGIILGGPTASPAPIAMGRVARDDDVRESDRHVLHMIGALRKNLQALDIGTVQEMGPTLASICPPSRPSASRCRCLPRERTHGRRVGWCCRDGQDVADALIRAGLLSF